MADGGVQQIVANAINVPRPFEEGDLTDWLDTYFTCAVANGWNEAQSLLRLPQYLRGHASAIYRQIPADDRDTWSHLGEHFTARFYPPETQAARMFELETIRWNPEESIDQFDIKLRRKLLQVYPHYAGDAMEAARNLMLKRYLLLALPTSYRVRISQIPNLTYPDMLLHARTIKAAEQFEQARVAAPTTEVTQKKKDALEERMAAMETALMSLSLATSNVAQRPQEIKQEPTLPANPMRSYNPNYNRHEPQYPQQQYGYYQPPMYQQQQHVRSNSRERGPNGEIRCYECSGFGHVARDCANRRQSNQSSTTAQYGGYQTNSNNRGSGSRARPRNNQYKSGGNRNRSNSRNRQGNSQNFQQSNSQNHIQQYHEQGYFNQGAQYQGPPNQNQSQYQGYQNQNYV